jgi:ribulose-phosphate 3-epimerase
VSYLSKKTASSIIPTIFSYNKKEFDYKLKKLVLVSKKIQVDLMDGLFVKNKSVLLRFIPDFSKYDNDFEVHLMVENPKEYFNKIKNKGFKKVIFHIESFKNVDDAYNFFIFLKKQKIVPVLAINPETKISKDLVEKFDFFLLMGVHPGEEKQSLIKSIYRRIRLIKEFNSNAFIQIDGGVNPGNSSKLFKAGATFLNSGSFISESEEPKKALLNLIKGV